MSHTLGASRIRLRPRSNAVHVSRGRTVLGMDREGTICPDNPRQGLFVYQTRILSDYQWKIDGKQPHLSAQSPVEQHTWLAYYYDAPPNCKETPTGECNPLQETIELKICRVVGEGMHEDVEVTNHTQISTSITLSLAVDADFVSRKEIKEERKQKGELKKKWKKIGDREWQWDFQYSCEHHYHHQGNSGIARLQRGITLDLHADSEPSHSRKTISFHLQLQPHQTWKACLKWRPQVAGNPLPIEENCEALLTSDGEYSRKQQSFLSQSTFIHTPAADDLGAAVQRVLDRSRLDLASLRLYDLDQGEHNWKLAAGIPTYLALFGRDMLAAAWQASLLSNDMSRGALTLLANKQAHDTNDWRDAQPGRILHEQHTDPLSVLNFTPQGLYFGSANASLLYPIIASEVWHWTGDKDAVRPAIKPALEALAWADKYSWDDSGFYKYQTRSAQGVKNQGWKDSSDAIVYPDGSQVDDPLGTCEMQAFAYAAKLHFSELLWWVGEIDQARKLHREAEELKKRFNDRFWMEDENYVAMAIDKDNRMVKTIASDPGHCVLSGILNDEFVPRVINRLMQPDMFSGWGIRTLSSGHPAYNPFAYHRGTVWPVENGAFVLATARYGLHGEMWRLSRSLFEAASLFDYDRLPEVFGGHARDEHHPFPCLYEEADSPQAWSASVPFAMLQALLGIYPYAPLDVLFLDPRLPDWLPQITLEGLRIGKAIVNLRCTRQSDGTTDYEVLDLTGPLYIVRQPSPWSLTSGWAERVRDAVASLIPHRQAS
ncbi:MAG TPA: glycogen debranching N-terminal domain-containing protein [Candidatus Sulfotelmatobacter sp.]|nr:glycogen debranching N-terminal domain-containing protein [Candidatus Sulfotelmatobacter sp.]